MELVCKKADPETGTRSDAQSIELPEPVISCRNCLSLITRPEFALNTGQGFAQTFANPAGHVFEIGCFSSADGCVRASAPSSEFSWFPGFDWSIGICRNCAIQLGWIFFPTREGQGSRFYGLILDMLIFPS